jgi:hypothetical protein
VSALPVVPKAALAAIVCASMWRAFLAGGGELLGSLLIIAGIETSCVAAWLVRGARDDGGGDDGDGGGGGGGSGPKLPPPIDWEAFDRARRAWDRTPATR